MAKFRKLKKNERRILKGGRYRIYKPKSKAWKNDKFYNKNLKAWVYSSTRKPRQKRIRQIQRKEAQEHIIPFQRIRKQIVLNFRGRKNPYYVSIRAITINPDIEENGLKIAISEALRNSSLDLSSFDKRYLGYEKTPIANTEDTQLNDMRIHVEVLIKRNKPIIYKL